MATIKCDCGHKAKYRKISSGEHKCVRCLLEVEGVPQLVNAVMDNVNHKPILRLMGRGKNRRDGWEEVEVIEE